MVRKHKRQYFHCAAGMGMLLISGCIVPFMAGCMVPEYQNPSGFSETYKRNLDALPLPEPSDRLTQKVLYDMAQIEQMQANSNLVANKRGRKQNYRTASNKGSNAKSPSPVQDDPAENLPENESYDYDTESDLEIISHQRLDNSNDESIDLDSNEELEEKPALTRWQKLTRIFAR